MILRAAARRISDVRTASIQARKIAVGTALDHVL